MGSLPSLGFIVQGTLEGMDRRRLEGSPDPVFIGNQHFELARGREPGKEQIASSVPSSQCPQNFLNLNKLLIVLSS